MLARHRSFTYLLLLSAIIVSPATSQDRMMRPTPAPPGLVKELKHAPDGKIARLQIQVAGRSISRFFPDSLRDGPHVYWNGDKATVHYACFGDFPERALAPDALRFAGFCHDEHVEYALNRDYESPPATLEAADRVFVVGNVHGHYAELVALLRSAGLVDEAGTWQWGEGHLVVLGNVVTGGPQVTGTLWFLKALSTQAEASGGAVHVLLGGDEFQLLGGRGERPHWKYGEQGLGERLGPYAGRLSETSELGRWLRSRNAAIRIGETLFMTGGLHPASSWVEAGVDGINEMIRRHLSGPLDAEGRLLEDPLQSPLYYRGYWSSSSRSNADDLGRSLARLGARWIVVGGDGPTSSARLNGRVLATAGPFEEGHDAEGILIHRNRSTRVDAAGTWVGLAPAPPLAAGGGTM